MMITIIISTSYDMIPVFQGSHICQNNNKK